MGSLRKTNPIGEEVTIPNPTPTPTHNPNPDPNPKLLSLKATEIDVGYNQIRIPTPTLTPTNPHRPIPHRTNLDPNPYPNPVLIQPLSDPTLIERPVYQPHWQEGLTLRK